MQAMMFSETKPVEQKPLDFVEVAKPKPGEKQVLLKVIMCGVCHTDLHIVEGDINPAKNPIIPGHQVIGIVDALVPGVENIKVGERVGVPWLYGACGECQFCLCGNENLCSQACFTGFHVDGGYAEYLVAEADYVLPIPKGLESLKAAPLLCAGIIGYRSLHQADTHPGERLGLVGFGASAHLTIQVARYWGCEVYVFTRSKNHRQHARELGAAWVGGIEDQAPKLLDRAIIFAPAGQLVPKVLAKLRPGGTLAVNAIHMSTIPKMSYQLIYQERTLRSVANATYKDGVEFIRLAAEIPILATTEVYPLEKANQALLAVKNSAINGEAVLKI